MTDGDSRGYGWVVFSTQFSPLEFSVYFFDEIFLKGSVVAAVHRAVVVWTAILLVCMT